MAIFSFDIGSAVTPVVDADDGGSVAYPRQLQAPSPDLLTYLDVYEHLVSQLEAPAQDRNAVRARHAVQDALRETVLYRDWRYYRTWDRINLVAPYETGTVTASEGATAVTLADGTPPSWAPNGHLIIADDVRVYPVVSVSGSTLNLDPSFPIQTAAVAATYTLFRTVYPFPADLVRLTDLNDEDGCWGPSYVTPDEWLSLMRRSEQPQGGPFSWTLMGDPRKYGAMAVHLWGYPSEASTLDFIYQRRARPLHYLNESAGTVTATTSGDTISLVGVGTAFSSRHVGSVMRLGTSAKSPTGRGGASPFDGQGIITSVASATSATAVGYGEGSGVKYSISDPVDVPEYLHTLFLLRCEMEMVRNGTSEAASRAVAMHDRAIIDAMERDAMVPITRRNGWQSLSLPGVVFSSGGM